MKITKSQIAIIAIIVLSFAVSFYYYPQLPEKIASHWNARGEVDGYMNKTAGAFIMPVVMTGMVLMFFVILRIDPLKKNIEKFKGYYYGFIIAMCLFLFGVHWWMMLWNIGVKVSVNRVMPAAIGALFFFMGHIMKNIKRNWFMGIKTPWTLSNDIVWKRTHDVSGRLFMACGVIAMCGMFFPKYSIWFILVPVLATAVFSIVYSYVVYKKVTAGELDGTAEEMKIESSGDTTWDNIKEGYLYQVERSLSKVKHTAKKQVLEDVSSHLDQKYAELNEDDKVWESYQQIITEMGPAEDYAELLNGDTPQVNSKSSKWFLYFIIFNFIVLALVLGFILLPNRFSKRSVGSDITIDTFRIVWQGLPKGRFKIQTNILNRGRDRCGEFDFVIRGVDYFENLIYTAGPIESGEIWHAETIDFKLPDGVYEFTVELDPENQIQELNKDNNRKTNKFKLSYGKAYHVDDETSAYSWLELIDNGRYSESWEQAASIFKANVSRAQWETALEGIFTPLGKVISREVISQTPTKTVPGGPDGDYVIIRFRTDFENKKGAIETVTPMLEKDGQWRVSGYFIK